MEDISAIEYLIKLEHLKGLSITIPYKLEVVPFCSYLSEDAEIIGAVNCIAVGKDNKIAGHNTDWIGFRDSLQLKDLNLNKKALVCGTGGASKAIIYCLKELNIDIIQVSSSNKIDTYRYEDVNASIIQEVQLIINCTHLGTFPNINECVNLPYDAISSLHYCYDLVYNPEETLFLKKSKSQGAKVQNGYEMLARQAEAAWEIWNEL